MVADWPTLAQQARAALVHWDAYCPDDGRPLWALDVAEAYWHGRADDAELGRVVDTLAAMGAQIYRLPPARQAHRVLVLLLCPCFWLRDVTACSPYTGRWAGRFARAMQLLNA